MHCSNMSHYQIASAINPQFSTNDGEKSTKTNPHMNISDKQ